MSLVISMSSNQLKHKFAVRIGKVIFAMLAIGVLLCAIFGMGLLIASDANVVRFGVASSPLYAPHDDALTLERQDRALLALDYVTGRSDRLKASSEVRSSSGIGDTIQETQLPRNYTQDEVSHMADVRAVMLLGRRVALFSLAFSLIAIGVALKLKTFRALARVLAWAGAVSGALIVLGIAAGFVGFDGLFSGFHTVFFADGTWQFSENSLLLSLFPLKFWIIEAAVWALGSLGAATTAFLASVFVRLAYVEKGTSGVN